MSYNFPTTSGVFDQSQNGGRDVFITSINTTGTALRYSTYLGGSSNETGCSIRIDHSGDAIIAGETSSSNFPVLPAVFDENFNGVTDAFITTINQDGTELLYSSFFGGSGEDNIFSLIS